MTPCSGKATNMSISYNRSNIIFAKSEIKYSLRRVKGYDLLPKDVKALVQLHQTTFPGFFLTLMGPDFLKLLYYGFLQESTGICIIAEDENGVIGFAIGTTSPDSFFRTLLLNRGISFALTSLNAIVRDPVFVVCKCLGALLYRGERPDSLPQASLLSSLAVSPHVRGSGVGRQLVDAFCSESSRGGQNTVYVVTDALQNDIANLFYEKCGFHLVDRFNRFGNRRMNTWAKFCINGGNGWRAFDLGRSCSSTDRF